MNRTVAALMYEKTILGMFSTGLEEIVRLGVLMYIYVGDQYYIGFIILQLPVVDRSVRWSFHWVVMIFTKKSD